MTISLSLIASTPSLQVHFFTDDSQLSPTSLMHQSVLLLPGHHSSSVNNTIEVTTEHRSRSHLLYCIVVNLPH